ncbi:MAG TPA: 2-phospho-L-lactate guanylyltransferase [Methanothrix sp.]|nr:2-phospho-L-lactate guanylyltransferase [Methanothrix sp.]HOK57581.1 2-phospho-L-lactate guanylyltransferase [Methanothrix sp.]HOL42881.1 2-phospho-L-lactate guanylyltransferase [Methanothrix sp.]HPO87866.1 2-phospho-L-lactate guanylyltransferase [Methanothrix sp.]
MLRPVHCVVPFKSSGCKTRLSPILSAEQRWLLAVAMLRDVLRALRSIGMVTVLARPGMSEDLILDLNASLRFSELELGDALNVFIDENAAAGWPADLLIVMADLPLICEEDVLGMISVPGDVVLAPGRGGGTNMILIRDGRFRTRYRGLSFARHQREAEELGIEAGYYYSYRAGCDIDEPGDLIEIMLHSNGESRALLERFGLSIVESEGRARLNHIQADGWSL